MEIAFSLLLSAVISLTVAVFIYRREVKQKTEILRKAHNTIVEQVATNYALIRCLYDHFHLELPNKEDEEDEEIPPCSLLPKHSIRLHNTWPASSEPMTPLQKDLRDHFFPPKENDFIPATRPEAVILNSPDPNRVTPPYNGGCWFCFRDTPDMVFDTEFDTNVHLDCIRQHLTNPKSHNHTEAQMMAYLLPPQEQTQLQ
jgi:hypothetical protein